MNLLHRLTCVLALTAALTWGGGEAQARTARRPALGPPTPHTLMVAAANPMAAEAGMKVLRAGGSAADAAVAVQAVLGLVEPQASGLGGGAFMAYYDARTRKVTAYNGRETAPAGAAPDMFLGPNGKPLPFFEAVNSGRSTGVPGAVAMLYMVHKAHGVRPWRTLFADGERLADGGFIAPQRLGAAVALDIPTARTPDVVAYATKPDGKRFVAGDRVANPAYAAALRRIAAEGPKGLLQGEIGRAIVAKTHEEPHPGTLTLEDLAAYRPEAAPALCRPYRIYVICTPPPPASGVGLLQALALLAHTDIDRRGPADPVAWSQLAQASRLMYADRDRYVADPDFIDVPVEGLLDPDYVKARAALIGDMAGPPPPPGSPRGAGARAPDATAEPGGTSHFVIVDARGDAVSMTTTVEAPLGSGRMTHGFLLNNQLTDFSFSPTEKDGVAAANAVAPRKRPRSSMSPVIVLDRQGRLVAALGSPGGTQILAYNLKALVAVLDWHMSLKDAFALPNLIARGASVGGETDKFAPGVVEGLAARGLVVKPGQGEASGLHGVMLVNGRWTGAADTRREGVVLFRKAVPAR